MGYTNGMRKFSFHPRKLLASALVLLLAITYVSIARGQSLIARSVFLPLIFQANSNPTPTPTPTVTPGPDTNPIHEGVATYYYATGDGACLFGPSPNDLMVAAIDTAYYDGANLCGAYLHVIGPQGDVTVRIVDWCPDCSLSHVDLSQEAFAEIAPLPLGIVNITWQIVSPDLPGPIAYHFKDGSNQWWTAVQIRNHRNPIAKLEYYNGSQWLNVPRMDWNYFVEASGMGLGPYTFRVTDMYGNVLVDSGIPHAENGTVNGAAQFPPGP